MSETYIYAKPAHKRIRGAKEATPLKIRDPRTGQHMPAYGAKLELTTAVRRMLRPDREGVPRLQRGPDLVEISKDEFESGKATETAPVKAKPKPAPAPAPAPAPKSAPKNDD